MGVKDWTITGLSCMLLFTACTEQEPRDREKARYNDELHRPSDWTAEMQLVIAADTLVDEEEKLPVVASTVSASFEGLLDQIYDLSFSGDVPVYAPDVFGEMSRDYPMTPEDLVHDLKAFDTITIEDIHTGALRDTVVDVSFTRNSVSALTVYLTLHEQEEALWLNPYAVSVGRQVFNASTGTLRGVSNKFFVELESDGKLPPDAIPHRLFILSDSNGVFRPVYFSQYNEGGNSLLQDLLQKSTGDEHEHWRMEFHARFDYADHRLIFEGIRLVPVGKGEMAGAN